MSDRRLELLLLYWFKELKSVLLCRHKCWPQSDMCFFILSALILEEIAIDCHNKETEERLLQEAHDLHLSSLQLAKKAFGEFNVQTAKHYGNLGRLYQSMRKFKVAVCLSVSFCCSVRCCKI